MRICLNMIVRNEADVVRRCLESVLPYVDAWAIVDTGSTDGTQELIGDVLSSLPGELITRPWVDFSQARNEALELAGKYGDYAFVIDADDVFDPDPGFEWGALGGPGYCVDVGFADARSWSRVQLLKTGMDWHWEGAVHEIPASSHFAEASKAKLHGARICVVGGGWRSRQSPGQRSAGDIDLLRRRLAEKPEDPRSAFLLAQSLSESGQLVEAINAYRRRAELGGWSEEIYVAKFQIAVLRERLGERYDDVVAAYLDAYDYRPQRAEAPCELARYLRGQERYSTAYAFAHVASAIGQPADALNVDLTVYHWRARDEFALAAYFIDDYPTCIRLWNELLADPRLPSNERERIQANREAALEAAQSTA